MVRGIVRAFVMSALAVVIVITSYTAGFGSGWFIARPQPLPTAEEPQPFGVFWEAWRIVEQEFYGPIPDIRDRTYGAIRGMLRSLGDPNTVFLDPQVHELEKTDLQGGFEGIGAIVTMEEGQLVVISPLDGSPALRAGIKSGDVILKVDDTEITGMSLTEAVLLIRGPRGTKVRLTILRAGEEEPLVIEVIRAEIQTPTVAWRLLEDKVAYLRISLFGQRTNEELTKALRELEREGATGLVVDLRNNPGGFLDSAIDVTSQFLKSGIVVYEQRKDQEERSYPVKPGGLATDIPLVVLVNEGSASASEIMAGAIQDHERGVLIGQPTLGKGVVQNVHELSDGSSLHVTVALWLTPDHHQINETGLFPDIPVPFTKEDFERGVDPQLDRALEYLKTGQ